MKQGLSLSALAQEIERRANNKADFIAPSSKMSVEVVDNKPVLSLSGDAGVKQFGINGVAHGQLAEYAGIPLPYYRKMASEAPALLATNVNRWLADKGNERRMVRVLDNDCRALLSDKYRILDHDELAEAVLPVLLDMNLLILSCQITSTRLYIKAVDRDIERQVPTGKFMGDGGHTIFDCVAPAIIVSNSECGFGGLTVESGVWTRACTNLANFGASMRKYHTGARASVSDEVFALLTDQTKKLTDAAVWAQTRDMVKGAFDVARFEATCKKLGDAAEQKIEGDVVEVVEVIGKRFGLGVDDRKGILARLIEFGSLTKYGISAAVTRHSAEVEDYDAASEMEHIGAQVIDLDRGAWSEVLKQAA